MSDTSGGASLTNVANPSASSHSTLSLGIEPPDTCSTITSVASSSHACSAGTRRTSDTVSRSGSHSSLGPSTNASRSSRTVALRATRKSFTSVSAVACLHRSSSLHHPSSPRSNARRTRGSSATRRATVRVSPIQRPERDNLSSEYAPVVLNPSSLCPCNPTNLSNISPSRRRIRPLLRPSHTWLRSISRSLSSSTSPTSPTVSLSSAPTTLSQDSCVIQSNKAMDRV
jgi:hypothetical protein